LFEDKGITSVLDTDGNCVWITMVTVAKFFAGSIAWRVANINKGMQKHQTTRDKMELPNTYHQMFHNLNING
jgi:hypothetical protein